MMKLFLLSILYSLSLLNPGSVAPRTNHALYVSVLEIEKDRSSEKASIMVKIFSDDLEDAIFNHAQQRLDLQGVNCDQGETYINNYFNDHLKLSIDGKEQSYSYLSCEVNDISLWLTFEFTTSTSWNEVEITADYLIELFPTQSNVVSITYHSEKRMFRLTKGSTTETISF